ncbi:MAG: hypothetical protein V9E99_08425 [Microthrixaceae bacterium]
MAAPAGLYLATSGGPQASARFRVPITPTLAVFAAVPLCRWFTPVEADEPTAALVTVE